MKLLREYVRSVKQAWATRAEARYSGSRSRAWEPGLLFKDTLTLVKQLAGLPCPGNGIECFLGNEKESSGTPLGIGRADALHMRTW